MDINTVNITHLWSKLEDKIVPGDVITYGITPKFDLEPPQVHGQTMVQAATSKVQPFLMTGILTKIIDDKRIQVLNSDGTMVVLDKVHFSDFSKLYDKSEKDALAFYFTVAEMILARIKLPFDYAYKVGILCKLSRAFNVRYNKRIKSMMRSLYRPTFDAAMDLGQEQQEQ
jgi:hypothetical protein